MFILPKIKQYSPKWIQKQLIKIEKVEPILQKRLPKIQKLQTRYDGSHKIYNLSQSDLSFKITVLKAQLKGHYIGKDKGLTRTYKEFMKEARQLSRNLKQYIKKAIDIREEAYLEHFKLISEKEYEIAKKYLDRMTDEQKEKFFTSNQYFITPDYSSESWRKFMDDFEFSVDFAKLQDFFFKEVLHREKGYIFSKYESQKELEASAKKKR